MDSCGPFRNGVPLRPPRQPRDEETLLGLVVTATEARRQAHRQKVFHDVDGVLGDVGVQPAEDDRVAGLLRHAHERRHAPTIDRHPSL